MESRRRRNPLAALLGLMATLAAPARAADLVFDTTYGRGGFAIVDATDSLTGGSHGYVSLPPAIEVLGDGSVLFGGLSDGGAMRLIKVAANGTLDAGFGRGGRLDLPVEAALDGSTPGLAVTGRGQIVVAGGLAGGRVRVLRLQTDGTLDRDFGDRGFAELAIPDAEGPSRALRIALDAEGRIVVVASCDLAGRAAHVACGPRAWRLLADGHPDPAFVGAAVARPALYGSFPLSVAVMPDGSSFVLLEEPEDIMENAERLVRLQPDGRVDEGFASPAVGRQLAAMLAHEGLLYVAQPGSLVRFDARGQRDESFGERGTVALAGTPIAAGRTVLLVALAPDGPGSLLGGGGLVTESGSITTGTVVTRTGNLGSGVIDRSFGRDGFAPLALGIALFNGQALRRDAAGRVLVAGFTSTRMATGLPIVARLRSSADAAAGGPGVVSFVDLSTLAQESSHALQIDVVRTGGSRGPASVEYGTVSGSAIEGADFAATRGRLDWGDGDDGTRSIVIPLLDDADAESAENFSLELRNPIGAAIVGPARLGITIQVNDAVATGTSSPAAPPVVAGGGSSGAGRGGGGGGPASPALLWLLAAWLWAQRGSPALRQPRLRP